MISETVGTRHYQQLMRLGPWGQGLYPITQPIQDGVSRSGITTGLCTVFLRHTSASLIIQENADPDVLADLESFMARLVPESYGYRHCNEGPDDMPAHIRTALTHSSETIPVMEGRLALGTWQGLYLWEHRRHPSTREIILHVTGGA
ncbi:MAG: secondary thiamine-phosphate synthase enzyme YjbQ [Nodosilinea sp.]